MYQNQSWTPGSKFSSLCIFSLYNLSLIYYEEWNQDKDPKKDVCWNHYDKKKQNALWKNRVVIQHRIKFKCFVNLKLEKKTLLCVQIRFFTKTDFFTIDFHVQILFYILTILPKSVYFFACSVFVTKHSTPTWKCVIVSPQEPESRMTK